jgi:hypothetical protein
MRRSRFTEEEIVAIIRDADRESVPAVARRLRISKQAPPFSAALGERRHTPEAARDREYAPEELVAKRDLEIEITSEWAKKGERACSSATSCVYGACGLSRKPARCSRWCKVALWEPNGGAGCLFDDWPGLYNVLQRTLAEIMIALEIVDRRLRQAPAP